MAIQHVLRERHVRKMEALIASGLSSEMVSKILKQYDEIAFPEYEAETLRYMAKAKKMMDSFKGKSITVHIQK